MIETFRRIPFAILLFPLIIGIVVGHHVNSDYLLQSTEFPYLDSVHTFKVTVTDYPSARAKTDRYEVEILCVADSLGKTPLHGQAYLYIKRDSTRLMPQIGDTLWVRTSISRGQQMGDFDYGLYLRRQGIIGSGYVASCNWQLVGTQSISPWNPRRWQHQLVERYRQLGFSGAELGTIAALSVGYKEDLEESTIQSFRHSGAAHILAVSGLHTGIIYAVMLFLLNGLGLYPPLYEDKTRKIINGCICITVLWLYALLTNMTPSVVRSVIMFSLVEIARMTYRQPISLNTVFAAAFLILMFRPNDIYSLSFQLSFAAVTMIVCCNEYLPSLRITNGIKHRLLKAPIDYIWGLIVISIVAQIGTIPLSLYYFGQTSNWFVLTNIVVIPLAWLIVVGALMMLTIGWIPGVGEVIAIPTKWLVAQLNHYTAFIEHLPGAVSNIYTTLPMVVCLYIAIVGGFLSICQSRWWLLLDAAALSLFCYLYTL